MPDLQPYMNYILAAIGVLVLLVLIMLAFRMAGRRSRGRKGMRLGIVEYCEIDQTRRLVLLRRDDVEHLVLIGGGQDLVVESDIGTGLHADQPAPLRPAPPERSDDVIPMRPPRAPVFGAKRPPLRPIDTISPEDDRDPA